MTLALGSASASVVTASISIPRGILISVAATAAISVAALVFLCIRDHRALNHLTQSLRNPDLTSLSDKAWPLFMPLAYAIEKLNASTNTQTQDLTDRNSDLSIQFQLLQRQKQNSEAIIYSIRDIVLVTDSFDRIIMASAAASQFFGFKIEDANLKPIEAFVSDENFVEIMTRARTNELAHVKHEVTFADDPKQRTFDCIISCVKDDKEIISGVVAVLHDVTKEKEISKTKNDFVSHVSHELKTPLSSINAYAEMLVDGEAEDAETIKQFSTIIQTQAQRLNRLIEDILNISRIESGLTKITKKPISLAMLVRDAVEMITSYAAEKNINIVEPHSIVCDQVYADKDMITQVIINLLSNAVKYTEQGGTVTINLDVNDADQFVKVSVSDTGVGIPAEDVEHVFDKFFRVDANKKYAKGTGLGLNLVKQIVEKTHEGAVFVTSQQGKGSTFAFTLPLESARVLQKV